MNPRGRLALAVAAALLCACATSVPEAADTRLTAAAPQATVELDARAGPVLAVEITRIVNPARTAFTLVVATADGEILSRLAPFPPDQPARFAIRAPAGLTRLQLRLEPVDGRPLPEAVELRIGELPRR